MNTLLIGKAGVRNAQTLINTTSKNINNVNTEGYVRKETLTYTSTIDWGVGDTVTRRVYNQYVQRELFTDNGRVGYYKAYKTGMETVDKMLSDDSMSMATSLNSFFDSLADSVQNPTDISGREEVMAELSIMIQRYNFLNESMYNDINDVNAMIADDISDFNNYARAIHEVNAQIKAMYNESQVSDYNTNDGEIYMELLDKRDLLIEKMSSLANITTVQESDTSVSVYLSAGQLVANAESYIVLNTQSNKFDTSMTDVYLQYENYAGSEKDQHYTKIGSDIIGGSIGGYMDSTVEIREAMRQLGRLAVAFADSMNVQNEAGFTLNNVAGSEILGYDEYTGISTASGVNATVTFNRNEGEEVQSTRFYVNTKGGSLDVYTIDKSGTKTKLTENTDYTVDADDSGYLVIDFTNYGTSLNFNKAQADVIVAAGEFYFDPLLRLSETLENKITKGEDLAYASAVRTNTGPSNRLDDDGNAISNMGDAVISLAGMSLTGDDMGVSVDNDGYPQFNSGAPVKIVYGTYNDGTTSYTGYLIYDSSDNYLGYSPSSTNGLNIFENAVWVNTYSDGYPGYEVSVTGNVSENDAFYIEINTDGVADNSNGITMAAKRTEKEVGGSSTSETSNTTFVNAFADLTSQFGSSVLSASTSLEAATSKQAQTQALYDSESGVNLDEEAANLLMYQQTYQACAKILQAAQTVFDSLIAAF